MADNCPHPHPGADTMKAALKTLKGDFNVTEVDAPPPPGSGWVKARVRVAGICGTDCATGRSRIRTWNAVSWATNWPGKWSRSAPR